MRDSVFKKLCIVALTLGMILFAESITLGYQYATRPHMTPNDLKSKYTEQQVVRAEIQKKLETIANADNERKRIMYAVSSVVNTKPSDIFFTSLRIEDTGVLQLECFSQNPESFHLFVENLNNQNDVIANAKVEKITNVESSKGYKTSQIKTDFK